MPQQRLVIHYVLSTLALWPKGNNSESWQVQTVTVTSVGSSLKKALSVGCLWEVRLIAYEICHTQHYLALPWLSNLNLKSQYEHPRYCTAPTRGTNPAMEYDAA
ncbi:uncharacterized protein EDB91DRAFT_303848 [Suillus paluster]|uniref:uncharacterized protein n=1 Tax=Suillus paluster TaxID=48578 RepID=UPI001B86986F|nr:uncharacterized protein EDB91DRAFT_303848 [Suillus paluster]KAG1742262.1 hypothetical protein EDB91DRAFT_303848 [Suillus paluster]